MTPQHFSKQSKSLTGSQNDGTVGTLSKSMVGASAWGSAKIKLVALRERGIMMAPLVNFIIALSSLEERMLFVCGN